MNPKIETILTHLKSNTRTLAIDGRGGSGKSTLARALRDEVSNSIIVTFDDFYSPELGRSDRTRLIEQVLLPHSQGKTTQYQRYDWASQSLTDWIPVDADQLLILEGVSVLHPEFLPYLDLKIWLDCDEQVAFARGLHRDRVEYGVNNEELWRDIWIPQENAYITELQPHNQAEIVLSCAE